VTERADGYEPRFDIDMERGAQGEMFVAGILDALRNGGTRIEVKRDDKSQFTGNVYVEYECMKRGWYVPSGIATTEALIWVFVLEQDQLAVCIATERLKVLARAAIRAGRVGEERDGSHPTRGALVRITDLLLAGTHAMRTRLLPKYGA